VSQVLSRFTPVLLAAMGLLAVLLLLLAAARVTAVAQAVCVFQLVALTVPLPALRARWKLSAVAVGHRLAVADMLPLAAGTLCRRVVMPTAVTCGFLAVLPLAEAAACSTRCLVPAQRAPLVLW
jgi:hypothetical protein